MFWAKLGPFRLFLQRHSVVVFFVLSAALTVTFYYDVVFLGKTMLSPGGLTAGVMGDDGAYGDINPLPPDFSKFAVFMKDLGSNAWAGEPQVAKAAQAIRNFDLPLWNDNAAVGKPLAANFLSSAFYPLKLILYAMPNVHGWEIYLLARFSIAVFFFFLFLRELKVKVWPAFLGGALFAFSGYFIMLQNIQNMDVDLLAPVMFWVVAYAMNVARQERIRWIQYVLMVGALSVVFLSNIPESLILVLASGFLFWAYRLFALYRSKDRDGFKRALRLALQIVIPVGLIVLPLYMVNLEFIQQAITTHESGHEVGSSIYIQPNYLAFYVLPYIQNASLLIADQPVNANTLNYIGMVAYFLVLVGAVTAFKQKSSRLFLLILGAITVAKIHGVPVINEVIGNAPGFDRVMYMKYAQPIVSLCAASLVGFGIEALWERKVKPWELVAAILAGLLLLWQAVRILPGFDMSRTNVMLVMIVFGLLLALGLLVLTSSAVKWRLVGATALGVLLIAELWNFIPRHGRPERYETFTQPPFVTFLKSRPEPFRIYAYDGLLYPDISSGFNLDDIRDLDGLIVGDYMTYVRHFISHSVIDRFTGKKSGPGEAIPAVIVNNPFIDILNVTYLVAQNPPLDLYPENEINKIILSHNPPTPSLREAVFDIHADMRRVLFEHTPGLACAPLPVTKDAPMLRFSYGIDEQAWNFGAGDGVQFVVTGPDGELVFEAKVNPVAKVTDQTWFDQSIDLSSYAGTNPNICFHTNPMGDTVADWAGWADLRLTPIKSDIVLAEQTQVKLVYRGNDAYVYENLHATSRAFTVGRVTSFSAEWDMIKYMRQPGFDPITEAVILAAEGQPDLPVFDGEACAFETVENYQEPKASLASLDVYSPGTCLLVWSDTNYPGWNAYVDGQKTHMYKTDLMLRGIVLTQGRHHIVMKYRPLSFYGGLIGTAIGLFLTAFWSVRFALRKKSQQPPSRTPPSHT